MKKQGSGNGFQKRAQIFFSLKNNKRANLSFPNRKQFSNSLKRKIFSAGLMACYMGD